MRIGIVCGDRLRHRFFANSLLNSFDAELLVVQKRDDVPKSHAFLSKLDSRLFDKHFNDLAEKEKEYFSPYGDNFVKNAKRTEFIDAWNLNSAKIVDLVEQARLDLLFVFGAALFEERLLKSCPHHTINLHGGLSPWFKGRATLFWPWYFMCPQYVGYTFHLIDDGIDSGFLVHQGTTKIFEKDGIHNVGCRTVCDASHAAVSIAKRFEEKGSLKLKMQRGQGKVFLASDFKPWHLRPVYRLFSQGFVKTFLDNRDIFKSPALFRQPSVV